MTDGPPARWPWACLVLSSAPGRRPGAAPLNPAGTHTTGLHWKPSHLCLYSHTQQDEGSAKARLARALQPAAAHSHAYWNARPSAAARGRARDARACARARPPARGQWRHRTPSKPPSSPSAAARRPRHGARRGACAPRGARPANRPWGSPFHPHPALLTVSAPPPGPRDRAAAARPPRPALGAAALCCAGPPTAPDGARARASGRLSRRGARGRRRAPGALRTFPDLHCPCLLSA
jgi:hypothetical protein